MLRLLAALKVKWRLWMGALFALLVVFVLGAYSAYRYGLNWLDTPIALPENGYVLNLKQGQSLAHASYKLASLGYLKHPRWLSAYANYTKSTHVQVGEYQLEKGLTPRLLMKKLASGDVIYYSVTLVEGWTFKQALRVIQAHPAVKPQLTDLADEDIIKALAIDVEFLEGWFFPDTYRFTRGTTDRELLARAHTLMQRLLMAEWEIRAEGLPYKTPYEALIMASIIERETGAEWERGQVAGVFVRRLQQGMRLQTDPTVIYGMGDRYQGKITRKDLQEATAYNTYVITGLPPTPIALPGRASIVSALHPTEAKHLYFVAKGDGTTKFSETLTEHNQAVRKYQLQRRADYRSTVTPRKTE